MAVGQREERQPARWLHTKNGDLIDKRNGETLGWASGVITGIRMAQSEKFGHLELHVRIRDPALDETVIIAGTLATVDPNSKDLRDFTIWSRMLVGRLLCTKNKLDPEEVLRLEFYPLETDYGAATCVALYRESAPDVRLDSVKISVDDREKMAKGLFWLADRYHWGSGSTDLPVKEEVEKLGAADPADRPPPESASDVAGSIESTAEDAETVPDSEDAVDAVPLPGNQKAKEMFSKPKVTEEQRAQVDAAAQDESNDDGLPF